MNMKPRLILPLAAASACLSFSPIASASFELTEAERAVLMQNLNVAEPTDTQQVTWPTPRMSLFSAKVTGLGKCEGNIGFSISNAFTDGTFKKIINNFGDILKEMVSPAGLVYLATLYIEKSNPNLYQAIKNGIDIGLDDFLSGIARCEAIGSALMSSDAVGSVVSAQQSTQLNTWLEDSTNDYWLNAGGKDKDMNHYINNKLSDSINDGVQWLTGKAGGDSSKPINVVADSVLYGWCYMRGIEKDQCNPSKKTKDTTIADSTAYNKMIKLTVGENIEDAIIAAQNVLGQKSIYTCTNCNSVSIEGKGSEVYLKSHKVDVYVALKTHYRRPPDQITDAQYVSMSAPGVVEVKFPHLQALRTLDSDDELQEVFFNAVAFDVAYARTIFLLNTLEQTFALTLADPEVAKSGLGIEVEHYYKRVIAERNRLVTYYETRNYKPHDATIRLLKMGGKRNVGVN